MPYYNIWHIFFKTSPSIFDTKPSNKNFCEIFYLKVVWASLWDFIKFRRYNVCIKTTNWNKKAPRKLSLPKYKHFQKLKYKQEKNNKNGSSRRFFIVVSEHPMLHKNYAYFTPFKSYTISTIINKFSYKFTISPPKTIHTKKSYLISNILNSGF